MKVGVLLSRQERNVGPRTWWVRAAAAAAGWAVRQGWRLVSGEGLLPIDFVRWVYRYHGGGVEEIGTGAASKGRAGRRGEMRRRDREVLSEADVLIGVAVRRGGIMEEEGLRAIAAGKRVWVVPPPGRTKEFQGNISLLKTGALDLRLPEIENQNRPPSRKARRSAPGGMVYLTPAAGGFIQSSAPPEQYLWHFTRSCSGPWPGQSQSDYFLSLVRNEEGAAHAAIDTLNRILSERTLRASGKVIRGGFAVVSFSAQNPAALLAGRKFRSALARWDFEACALGLPRVRAESMGVRPVSYLPSAEFLRLDMCERPYYQRSDKDSTDWTHEQEWRHVGDVDLSRAAMAELCLAIPAADRPRCRTVSFY